MSKTVLTHWELWSYDVWGNAEDGWQVNDRSCFDRDYTIRLKVEHNNVGTAQAFDSASPSDYQIKRAFGISQKIETDGDDTHITIDTVRGYPLGEMFCTSHPSLSPIRGE